MFLKLITGDEVFKNQENINSLHSLVGTKFAMILPGILSWRCATLQSCHPSRKVIPSIVCCYMRACQRKGV